jgi:phenylacetate-CoA ligase
MGAVVHSPLHPRLEFLPAEQIRALQGRKLRALVRRATAADGMYARHFREAGLDPDTVRGMDDLERIPFVTKQQMMADQEERPPFGTRLNVPEHEIARLAMSGGSSGGGRELVAHTRQDLLVLGGVQGTPFRWGGLGEDDVIVFHVPLENSTSSLAFPCGVEAVGRIKYLIAHEGFAERLNLMRTHGATGMWGTPSTLNGFTNECERLGLVPRELFPEFKAVIIAAENFPVTWAERIADLWGASLLEGYGATQTHGGYCLSSCEVGAFPDGRRGTMHGYEWSFVLEVRDPESGRPTVPGEMGELIVTTLDKRASPAIRYRTGDRVTLVEGPCPCGRETMLIESGTVGRYDDMLKVKGVNLWPDRVDEVVFGVPGVREYQATVVIGARGRDEVELRFAVRTPGSEERVGAEIARAFKRELHLTPQPIATPFEELAIRYGDGGKARRWLDRRNEMLR